MSVEQEGSIVTLPPKTCNRGTEAQFTFTTFTVIGDSGKRLLEVDYYHAGYFAANWHAPISPADFFNQVEWLSQQVEDNSTPLEYRLYHAYIDEDLPKVERPIDIETMMKECSAEQRQLIGLYGPTTDFIYFTGQEELGWEKPVLSVIGSINQPEALANFIHSTYQKIPINLIKEVFVRVGRKMEKIGR